ncbi:MAG TPA: hypothetical protein VFA66_16645 [Gaiellaceae bacterium]|nr:hypothetical protein [Gaiellaceae bacterium]
MRRASLVAVLALVLSAAACGGGGSKTLSKEEYGSRLNAICKDAAAQEKEIGTPTSPSELVGKGPELRAALDRAIAKAEKLKPPDELKTAADKFLAESKQLSSLLRRIVDAAGKNDVATLARLGAQAQTIGTDAAAVGKQLGAPACALAPG